MWTCVPAPRLRHAGKRQGQHHRGSARAPLQASYRNVERQCLNAVDLQAAYETENGHWGAVLGVPTLSITLRMARRWPDGLLEKLVLDVEICRT